MSVKMTTDANFQADVIENSKPVLVDFWAEWCGPCKALLPVLEELSSSLGESVDVMKVNIDENPDSPVKFGVRSIPTLVLFKDGQVLETQVGMMSHDDLKSWVEQSV